MKKILTMLLTVLMVATLGVVNVSAENNVVLTEITSSSHDMTNFDSTKFNKDEDSDAYQLVQNSTEWTSGDNEKTFVIYAARKNVGEYKAIKKTSTKKGYSKVDFNVPDYISNDIKCYFIAKAPTYSCTAPTLNSGLNYSGAEQELIDAAGSGSGCTIEYAVVSQSGTAPTDGWTSSASGITKVDAGTYYVWYRGVDASTSGNVVVDAKCVETPVTIAQAKLSVKSRSGEFTFSNDEYEFTLNTTNKNKLKKDDVTVVANTTAKYDTIVLSLSGVKQGEATYNNSNNNFKVENNKLIVSKDTKPGTYVATIVASASGGDANYDGGASKPFEYEVTINKTTIDKVTVIFDGDAGEIISTDGYTKNYKYIYSTSGITPNVVLKIGELKLEAGTDYTLGDDYTNKKPVIKDGYNLKINVDSSEYVESGEDYRKWYIIDNTNLASYVTINGEELDVNSMSGNYYVSNVEFTYDASEHPIVVSTSGLDGSTIKYSKTKGGSYNLDSYSITDVPETSNDEYGTETIYYRIDRDGFKQIYGMINIKMNKAVAYILPVYKKVNLSEFDYADYGQTFADLDYKVFRIDNLGTEKESWVEVNINAVTSESGNINVGVVQAYNTPITKVYPGGYYAGVGGLTNNTAGAGNNNAAINNLTNNYKTLKPETVGYVDAPTNSKKDYMQQAVTVSESGKVVYEEGSTIPYLTSKSGAFEVYGDLDNAEYEDENTYIYSGSGITANPTIYFNVKNGTNPTEKVTINATDYELSEEATQIDAGTYTYSASGITKYVINSKSGLEFTIDPADLYVTWDSLAFTYNGQYQTPVASYSGYIVPVEGVSGSGVANRDMENFYIDVTYSDPVEKKDVDSVSGLHAKDYKIQVRIENSESASGATSKTNYAWKSESGADFTINPKAISYSWSGLNPTYDGEYHTLTAVSDSTSGKDVYVVVEGVETATVEGNDLDKFEVSGSGKHYGTYDLSVSGTGYAATDYVESSSKNTLSIAKRSVTYSWSGTEVTYDGQWHQPTVTVNNIVKGEEDQFVVSGSGLHAAKYDISVSGINFAKDDYDPSTSGVELVINPKPIDVELDTTTLTYNGEYQSPKATVSESGLVYNVESGKVDTCEVSTSGKGKHAGEYTLKVNALSNPDYTFVDDEQYEYGFKINTLTTPELKVLSNKSKVYMNIGEVVTIKTNAPFDSKGQLNIYTRIEGTPRRKLESSEYTLTEGSTLITLTKAGMDYLIAGNNYIFDLEYVPFEGEETLEDVELDVNLYRDCEDADVASLEVEVYVDNYITSSSSSTDTTTTTAKTTTAKKVVNTAAAE